MTPERIAWLRGWQTLADGAIAVAIVAGLPVLVAAVTDAGSWGEFARGWGQWSWQIVQAAVVAGVTALSAYVRRRWVTPADAEQAGRDQARRDDQDPTDD